MIQSPRCLRLHSRSKMNFMQATAPPSGVESDEQLPPAPSSENGWNIEPGTTRLLFAELRAQTDNHAELLHEHEWLLLPSERLISLRGNAFAVENTLSGEGQAFIKRAPLPDERPEPIAWDMQIESAARLEINTTDNYEWARVPYESGKWGRIAALQAWSRSVRPARSGRDGVFLTNTWGDRGRDAHLSEAFMLREVEAAARLGADVVQIDDGWQNGITQNSAQSNGQGAWSGFWASHPDFWGINCQRFPNGLAPLVKAARERGLRFGLWFAPDSSNDAVNWERDANALLRLHFEEGIEFFKVDALKIESKRGEENLKRLFDKVGRESNERVTFDFDITAENRFGPFGLMEWGPLFVQNRYTDWGRYFPHATLRVLWQLAHWLDPVRLRLEWLNNARNASKLGDHPLAPARWTPEALFATTMMASPLGWFEVQNLPPAYFERAAPLVQTWKAHRDALHGGTIFPVGNAPDGFAWTGFVSLGEARKSGYALVFREMNPSPSWEVALPLWAGRDGECFVLGGQGRAHIEGGIFKVEGVPPLGFAWVRVEG